MHCTAPFQEEFCAAAIVHLAPLDGCGSPEARAAMDPPPQPIISRGTPRSPDRPLLAVGCRQDDDLAHAARGRPRHHHVGVGDHASQAARRNREFGLSFRRRCRVRPAHRRRRVRRMGAGVRLPLRDPQGAREGRVTRRPRYLVRHRLAGDPAAPFGDGRGPGADLHPAAVDGRARAAPARASDRP